MNRPLTTVVLAMTADGKIADSKRSAARFSSALDKAHLEKQISLVDGVLFGSGTLRAYGTTLAIADAQLLFARKQQAKPSQPIQIVCSASANIDPQWRFFRQPVPRWLLTTAAGAQSWRKRDNDGFEQILIADSQQTQEIDWLEAMAQLKRMGLHKLAILGGGELVASLLSLDLIDELWLTICPVILGGATAPTPVEGVGFLASQAPRLKLLSVERVEEEIFLHYRLQR
jgi:5-amino-6-(5-phosphoribosylamino)uracil reductase